MFGDAFYAALDGATNAAKSAMALIVTGGKKLVAGAEAVGAEAVQDVKIAVNAVVKAEQWAEKKTIEAAKWAEKQTVRAEKWAEKKTIQAAKWAEKEAVAVAVASAEAAVVAFDAVKIVFSTAVAGAAWVACAAASEGIKEIAMAVAPLGRPLQGVFPAKPKLPHDGEIVGDGCTAKGKNGSGVLPQCGKGTKPRISGKITYINGIQTDYPTGSPLDSEGKPKPGICKTMQLLANATCAEVSGVYNATGGMAADLGQCLTNIAKTSNSPSVHTLEQQMLASLSQNPPGMTIFAHSQGGLITQEAIKRVKNDLTTKYGVAGAEQRMQSINIKSFGTAEEGWPVGPKYEQFTNVSDTVPGAIAGAQLAYPFDTFSDNATIPAAYQHYFINPRLTPIIAGAHSIDDVYIPEYIQEKGQPECCA
jgi:hypothetical protein